MTGFIITGAILGFSAGFSPGPLLALVISETIRHDMKAGVKVAIAPIVTDLPIIFLSLFILAKISVYKEILGIVALLGGFLLFHMGYESLRIKQVDLSLEAGAPNSLKRGILVNALSPYPYLFWIGIGAPTSIKALDHGLPSAIGFIASFYVLLIGSKIILAIIVGKSKTFMSESIYIGIMKVLGLVLLIFALFLFRDGMKSLGVL